MLEQAKKAIELLWKMESAKSTGERKAVLPKEERPAITCNQALLVIMLPVSGYDHGFIRTLFVAETPEKVGNRLHPFTELAEAEFFIGGMDGVVRQAEAHEDHRRF
jgi:hypothetical protein